MIFLKLHQRVTKLFYWQAFLVSEKHAKMDKKRTKNVHFAHSMYVEFLEYTVKPLYNDHLRDPKFVAGVDRWLLFRVSFMILKLKTSKMWLLQASGRYLEVVVYSGLTVTTLRKKVSSKERNREQQLHKETVTYPGGRRGCLSTSLFQLIIFKFSNFVNITLN